MQVLPTVYFTQALPAVLVINITSEKGVLCFGLRVKDIISLKHFLFVFLFTVFVFVWVMIAMMICMFTENIWFVRQTREVVTQSIWILETELGKKPNSVVWFLPKIYFHIY